MFSPTSPSTGGYFGSYFSPSNLSHNQITPPPGGSHYTSYQSPTTQPSTPLSRHGRFTHSRKSDEFEPMSTSPIQSPHHQHFSSSKDGSFLPPFLAGESHSVGLHLGHRSPEIIRRHAPTVTFDATGSLFDTSSSTSANVKPGGEDVEALAPVVKTGPPTSGLGGEGEISPPLRKSLSKGKGFSPLDPATPIPLGTMPGSVGTSPSDSTTQWVTVFGFPPSSASYVFQQFSQYGTILEVKSNPGANWSHFKYSNTIEARRAINKNGAVLAGTMMVGVIACEAPGQPFIPEPASTNVFSPPPPQRIRQVDVQQVPLPSNMDPQLKSRIRTLGLSSNVGGGSPDVHQLPRQHNGFVSGALEWLFGW